jgi:hypothetical protein
MNAGVVVGVFVEDDVLVDFDDEHAARAATATNVITITRNPARCIE